MGNFFYCQNNDAIKSNTNTIIQTQDILQQKINVSVDVMVSHYTPSFFPLHPIINKETNTICRESWKTIMNNDVIDANGMKISGITAFYNDFYERLDQFVSGGYFDAVLSRHATGQNKITAKGAIILRVVEFALKFEEDNEKSHLLLYMLGKSHSYKSIRPWQYSIFVQTLLMTISARLGIHATNKVMEAWVNLFAYVTKNMLPAAIKNQVVETEMHINTSSTFHDEKINNEIQEIEEKRKVHMRSGASTPSISSSVRMRTDQSQNIIHAINKLNMYSVAETENYKAKPNINMINEMSSKRIAPQKDD